MLFPKIDGKFVVFDVVVLLLHLPTHVSEKSNRWRQNISFFTINNWTAMLLAIGNSYEIFSIGPWISKWSINDFTWNNNIFYRL